MADISSKVKALIDSVRGKLSSATPSGRPLDRQMDGYRLYMKEAQAMGEPVQPYQQWLSQQAMPESQYQQR